MAGGNWKEMFNAAVAEDMELLNYHVKMGIDIDYQHPEYLTSVFIETIRLNKLKSARYLLEKGADMYVQESFGKDTATSIAIAKKHYEALELMNEFKKADEQVDVAALKANANKNTSKNTITSTLLKIIAILTVSVISFIPVIMIVEALFPAVIIHDNIERVVMPIGQIFASIIISIIIGICLAVWVFKRKK